jgi:hypothetical protein
MRKPRPNCERCQSIHCATCAGSGEGAYDGSTCHACRGLGVSYSLCSACEEAAWRDEDAEYERFKVARYNAKYGRQE